jgi:8-oxo-dGTP pyrophosphatase MutT (NUDIX family)
VHGAAGLLLLRDPHTLTPRPHRTRNPEVLLQLRASWTHQGGSWGLLGGARDSHEDPIAAALREAAEEAGVSPGAVTVIGEVPGVEHGDWSYVYVIATASRTLSVMARTTESDELRWVALDAVPGLPLHPAFGTAWPRLHAGLRAGVPPDGPGLHLSP